MSLDEPRRNEDRRTSGNVFISNGRILGGLTNKKTNRRIQSQSLAKDIGSQAKFADRAEGEISSRGVLLNFLAHAFLQIWPVR